MGRINVLIAAGGTGGHLFPAQQLARRLHADCEVVFAGHKLGESPFFARENIPFRDIAAATPKRGGWLRFFAASVRGLFVSISFIRKFKPDVVVGFGSYHAFPVLLAAALLRKNIILFEANSILGKVNRLFVRSARHIAIQFPLETPIDRGVFVPLLPWVTTPISPVDQRAARLHYGLDPNRTTLLVFGGSQGASFLNEAMPQAVRHLEGVQVIHLTGKGGAVYEGVPACVKEFESQMQIAYAAADVVVCRSGAGTLAELIRYDKPALLIPYPHATDDHQWKNAKFLEQASGRVCCLLQKEAAPERIAEGVKRAMRLEKKDWKRAETIELDALVRQVGQKS